MRDDEQFPSSEPNSEADFQYLNEEPDRLKEVPQATLNRPEMIEGIEVPSDTVHKTINQAGIAEEKRLAEDQKLREQSFQQIEKKALKKEKWQKKRQNVVPVYKWFFVWLFLLFLPIINIFLIIYWGFFSDRINRNIRNAILGAIILIAAVAIVSIIAYYYPNFIDPRISQIFSEFFTGLSNLFATTFDHINAVIMDKTIN